MSMLAMKHQFYYNIPLPQFETGEHANEDSAYCKFFYGLKSFVNAWQSTFLHGSSVESLCGHHM
jgi:hypothetical protein